MKLEEAQALQGKYQTILKQMHTDQDIVSKDIADLEQACKHAEKKVVALQRELKQRAAENNAAMPATTAVLQGLNELRFVLSTHPRFNSECETCSSPLLPSQKQCRYGANGQGSTCAGL